MKNAILTIIFSIFMLFSLNVLAQKDDPGTLVEKKYKLMLDFVRNAKDKKDLHEKLRKEMDTFVDYREISRQALIQYWDTLKDSEKKEYTEAFKALIQRNYVKRFDPQKEFAVEFQGNTEFKEGKASVFSTIKWGKSEANVNYLFHKPDGKAWWAYDVIIDDVSMTKNYRNQFHKIYSKDGFKTLIAKINKKAKKEE
jgi:phospholipid transport system substrate-binding protein